MNGIFNNNDKLNDTLPWQKAEWFAGWMGGDNCEYCPIDGICNSLKDEDIPTNIKYKGKCFNAWYFWLDSDKDDWVLDIKC